MNWNEATDWEASWWSNCRNTFGEEYKQLVYAKKMGLTFYHDGKSPFNINLKDKIILDIGGGPCSLLLKCDNSVKGTITDPCTYPNWIEERYKLSNIQYYKIKAENILDYEDLVLTYDEIWIYNVLQHVENPQLIIENAKTLAPLIRIFEWLDIGVTPGHLHNLTEEKMNYWLNGYGKVEHINENYAVGKAYYGIFLGRKGQCEKV